MPAPRRRPPNRRCCGGGDGNQPALQAARVARDQALLNLSRTEVRAPADGTISQTDRLQVGAAVVTGVPVVTLVRGAHHLCRGQLQGNRPRQHVCRPARRDRDRRLSRRPHQRPCRLDRRRHRLAILGPARPECERQLGEGPPARAGAHRHRRRSRPADDRRPFRRRHRRHPRAAARSGRRRPASAMASGPARGAASRTEPGAARPRHRRGDPRHADAGARHHHRQCRAAAHAGEPGRDARDDHLGADLLYRRLGDRDSDHRLARRPGRAQARCSSGR